MPGSAAFIFGQTRLSLLCSAAFARAHFKAQVLGNRKDIFVTSATHIHANDMICGKIRRNFRHVRQSVGRLKGWNDTFGLTTKLERLKRFFVGDRHIFENPSRICPSSS